MAKDRSQPTCVVLTSSLKACIANGERLLDDAYAVEFQEPPATKLMLSVIAQEEFAKAFLLFMVRENVISWSGPILRAMNDHACKQLVGVIIEYVDPQLDTTEEMMEWARQEAELDGRLPAKVASATNVLRYEKISRWEANNWVWAEEPKYESSVVRIAEGQRDRVKQDALYVRLGRDAAVVSTPGAVTEAGVAAEFERAQTYRRVVTVLLNEGVHASSTYGKVVAALRLMFETPANAEGATASR